MVKIIVGGVEFQFDILVRQVAVTNGHRLIIPRPTIHDLIYRIDLGARAIRIFLIKSICFNPKAIHVHLIVDTLVIRFQTIEINDGHFIGLGGWICHFYFSKNID